MRCGNGTTGGEKERRVQITRKQYKDLQVAQSVGIIGERNEATIGQGHNERCVMG